MEVPFYYSFKEFKENYKFNFDRWKSIFTNGSENDFLDEVEEVYKFYCLDPNNIEVEEHMILIKNIYPKGYKCKFTCSYIENEN